MSLSDVFAAAFAARAAAVRFRFTAGVFLRPLPVGFSGEGAPSMRRTWKVFGVPSCEADGKRGESVQPP